MEMKDVTITSGTLTADLTIRINIGVDVVGDVKPLEAIDQVSQHWKGLFNLMIAPEFTKHLEGFNAFNCKFVEADLLDDQLITYTTSAPDTRWTELQKLILTEEAYLNSMSEEEKHVGFDLFDRNSWKLLLHLMDSEKYEEAYNHLTSMDTSPRERVPDRIRNFLSLYIG